MCHPAQLGDLGGSMRQLWGWYYLDLAALIPGWLHAGVRLAGLLPLHVVLRYLWVVSIATVGLDLNGEPGTPQKLSLENLRVTQHHLRLLFFKVSVTFLLSPPHTPGSCYVYNPAWPDFYCIA